MPVFVVVPDFIESLESLLYSLGHRTGLCCYPSCAGVEVLPCDSACVAVRVLDYAGGWSLLFLIESDMV